MCIAYDSALSYYRSVAHRVVKYAQPLDQLDVKIFGYTKILNDGRFLHVSNRPEFSFEYIKTIGDIEVGRSALRSLDPNNKRMQFLDFYNQEVTASMSIFGRHGYSNSISIFKFNEQHIETWWFMGDKDYEIPRIHAQNKIVLKKFACYFNTQALDIVNTDYSNFRLFEKRNDIICDPISQDSEKVKKFLQEIDIKRARACTPNGILEISIKEVALLQLIEKGRSILNIARVLSISEKTAITNISHLMRKARCVSRQDLILLYKDYIERYF